MADIEDMIFKQNVPGRWSSHEGARDPARNEPTDDCDSDPEDGLPAVSAEDEEDAALFKHAQDMANADIPEPIRRSILAERQRKSNTGVKGVIADYKAAKALESAQRAATDRHRAQVLTRIAEGAKVAPSEIPTVIESLQEKLLPADIDNDDAEDEDDKEFEDEEADDFLQKFREQRIQELRSKQAMPSFGNCFDIDGTGFLDQVEKEDKRVFVVVHLFESSVSASENSVSVDRVALPILTIYRGGENVAVLAGLAEELGEYFKREDVEWLIDSTING